VKVVEQRGDVAVLNVQAVQRHSSETVVVVVFCVGAVISCV